MAGAEEAELPIDVHYDKLVAWLADRGHLAGAWRRELGAVQARAAALAEGPAAPLVRGLRGALDAGAAPVDSLVARAVRDRLAEEVRPAPVPPSHLESSRARSSRAFEASRTPLPLPPPPLPPPPPPTGPQGPLRWARGRGARYRQQV